MFLNIYKNIYLNIMLFIFIYILGYGVTLVSLAKWGYLFSDNDFFYEDETNYKEWWTIMSVLWFMTLPLIIIILVIKFIYWLNSKIIDRFKKP